MTRTISAVGQPATAHASSLFYPDRRGRLLASSVLTGGALRCVAAAATAMAALSTRRMSVSAVSSDEGTWLRGGVLLTRIFGQFPQQWNLLLNGNTHSQSLKPPAGTVLDRAGFG
jgi:hypothetical protein